MKLKIDLPPEAFSALRTSLAKFLREMRLVAAVKWYKVHRISQSKAAEIAGVSRHEFLEALARFGVSPFQAGRGDYTRDRFTWLRDEDVDTIAKRILRRRKKGAGRPTRRVCSGRSRAPR